MHADGLSSLFFVVVTLPMAGKNLTVHDRLGCVFLAITSSLCHTGHVYGHLLDHVAISQMCASILTNPFIAFVSASICFIRPHPSIWISLYIMASLYSHFLIKQKIWFVSLQILSISHFLYIHMLCDGHFSGAHKYLWHGAQSVIVSQGLKTKRAPIELKGELAKVHFPSLRGRRYSNFPSAS